jgi:hypothetical protein
MKLHASSSSAAAVVGAKEHRGSVNDVAVDLTYGVGDVVTGVDAPSCDCCDCSCGRDTAGWAEWLGRWLGATSASKHWRCAVNAAVFCIVAFESVWWGSIVYTERNQPGICLAGAVVDSTRGMLATVACGCGALLVSRAWFNELLATSPPESVSRAAVDAAARRWLIAAAVYVGLDTLWMLYRNIAAWPFSLIGESARVRPSERTAIGSSNFVSLLTVGPPSTRSK